MGHAFMCIQRPSLRASFKAVSSLIWSVNIKSDCIYLQKLKIATSSGEQLTARFSHVKFLIPV